MPDLITLQQPGGLTVTLSAWGASWRSCVVPMAGGAAREVLLPPRHARIGADQPRTFMGATLGRYANRIAGGRIERDGQAWPLTLGAGERHQLHGGPQGWDTRCWTLAQHDSRSARYELVSPDGDQGFPGEAHASVTYALLDAQTLEITYTATVDAPSPLCLSNHAYFNLDARQDGACSDVRQHALQISAARYLPVDAELIPRGELADVAGTGFDFQVRRPVGSHYDHAFLLDAPGLEAAQAVLTSADGRLRMALSTTLPALQLYTGQGLGGLPAPDDLHYTPCAGLALEPQCLPDSPHHPEWPQPSCWLVPGERGVQRVRYSFMPA